MTSFVGGHETLTGDNIHVAHAFEYADAAARLAASGFAETDVGKLARQLSDNSLWMLIDDDPATWARIGGPVTTGEILLTAAGGWPSTTSGCAANAKNEYGSNDVDLYSLDFDADADEYAQWSIPSMPSDWDGGTITATFIWTAASGSGDVVWALQGRAYANGDAIDAAWGGTQTVTDTLTATGDLCVTAATGAITLAGSPAAGQFVQLRVYRDADNGSDTLDADAKLLGVKVYYGKA